MPWEAFYDTLYCGRVRAGEAQLAHVDDTLYVVTCFVEFVGQRSRDVFVKQKRHLHDYDSGRSSGTVMVLGSSSAAS